MTPVTPPKWPGSGGGSSGGGDTNPLVMGYPDLTIPPGDPTIIDCAGATSVLLGADIQEPDEDWRGLILSNLPEGVFFEVAAVNRSGENATVIVAAGATYDDEWDFWHLYPTFLSLGEWTIRPWGSMTCTGRSRPFVLPGGYGPAGYAGIVNMRADNPVDDPS